MTVTLKARFAPGKIVATPAALALLLAEGTSPLTVLMRHLTGDWGNLDAEDAAANERALSDGSRLFSSYRLPSGEKVWVITEANRSATTVLMPEDY
jgi:hypothetical protein